MNRRHIVFMLACAAAFFACAPRMHTASASEPAGDGSRFAVANGLDITLTHLSKARSTSFALEVKNSGRRTEVRFPSGKTHDFVVLDDKDREVWRWSAGRLFTQALQTRQLKTGDAIHFDATWTALKPGTYRVVAVLNTGHTPQQLETEFVVN